MDNVTQIVQKVRQAPWRVQRQWIGLFLLGLVVMAMVAGIYLNVTVRATLAGREIQALLNPSLINLNPDLQPNSIATNQCINSELEMQLADLTSLNLWHNGLRPWVSSLLLRMTRSLWRPGVRGTISRGPFHPGFESHSRSGHSPGIHQILV